MTHDDVSQMPLPCRACAFWEVADAPRGPQIGRAEQVLQAKKLTYRALELDWGPPGVIATDGSQIVGFATFVPGDQEHRTRRLGAIPSRDALVLTTVWVAEDRRGTGVAKTLLQRCLRHAHDARLRALEAVGSRAGVETCVLDEDFLLASGFVVRHDHPSFPLLRLDLRQTARWQRSVARAVLGLRTVVARRSGQTMPSPS